MFSCWGAKPLRNSQSPNFPDANFLLKHFSEIPEITSLTTPLRLRGSANIARSSFISCQECAKSHTRGSFLAKLPEQSPQQLSHAKNTKNTCKIIKERCEGKHIHCCTRLPGWSCFKASKDVDAPSQQMLGWPTFLLEAARGACRWGSRKRSKNRLRGARRAGLAGHLDSCDRSVQPHWCLSWNHLAKITISCVAQLQWDTPVQRPKPLLMDHYKWVRWSYHLFFCLFRWRFVQKMNRPVVVSW